MNLINKLLCFFHLKECNLSLIEIIPDSSKRNFRCSNCKKVGYKINVNK